MQLPNRTTSEVHISFRSFSEKMFTNHHGRLYLRLHKGCCKTSQDGFLNKQIRSADGGRKKNR